MIWIVLIPIAIVLVICLLALFFVIEEEESLEPTEPVHVLWWQEMRDPRED